MNIVCTGNIEAFKHIILKNFPVLTNDNSDFPNTIQKRTLNRP